MKDSTIAIFSPFPRGPQGYPHLDAVVDELSKLSTIRFFRIEERGLFLDERAYIRKLNWIRHPTRLLRFLKHLSGTLYRAYKVCNALRKDGLPTMVCIDNFAYSLASLLYDGQVILWSHDFVGLDNEHSSSISQILIRKITRRFLSLKGSIIIQDSSRLIDLVGTLGLSKDQLGPVYFLPVALPRIKSGSSEDKSVESQPVLLQIGGINSFRSASDQLIRHYTDSQGLYELYLHGFFSNDIIEALDNCERLPITSSVTFNPSKIPLIVQRATIGFISYNVSDLNFTNIAHASNQLVEFIRCAKPVIVHGSKSLGDYAEKKGLGIFIQDFSQLSDALLAILRDYTNYSDNAIRTFREDFDLSHFTIPLANFIVGRQ